MKRILFFLGMALAALSSCKKDKPQENSCQLPTDYHHRYYFHGQSTGQTDVHLTYDRKNVIQSDIQTTSPNGNTENRRYVLTYADAEKGWIQRMDFYLNNQLKNYRIYSYQNDKLIQISEFDELTGQLIISFVFSYNDQGKVDTLRTIHYDTGVDQLEIFFYNGDDLARKKVFNTSDPNHPLYEYEYRYDDKPLPYHQVQTKSWPDFHVHNVIYRKKTTYNPNGQTYIKEEFYELTYDDNDYPVKVERTNETGDKTYEVEITYKSCE